ncbi:MAG: cobyrinate a,c-diamide synthase, partial [Clostridia bacterium]|nr:cobyrinate a,c-diamide synthase [Clostridia bacterium]
KTTAVCAVLALLKKRGLDPHAFKCGPDYIDPMFHEVVLGVPSANLDPFFCGGNLLRSLLADSTGELAVVEGVMGYYDGTGPDGACSTYAVARETATPVILVVNGRGASASLLAVLEGFLRYRPDSGIRGVLFTNVTAMTYAQLKAWTETRFGDAIAVVGYLPRLPEDCLLGSRHLGLVTPAETADLTEKLSKTADLSAGTVDLDALLAVAESAPPLVFDPPAVPRLGTFRIAAARDDAFCFYYRDTLRLFEKLGAEIMFFSPLADEAVPEEADGLLLGGGYPELHAQTLERNETARESIRRAVASGMPTLAECGGFQYLGQTLAGHRMCGIMPQESENTGHLVRFGYITLTSQADGLLGPAGTCLPAHEFHYYDSTENGSDFTAVKPSGRSWTCVVHTESLYAGYPHLFLPASLPSAESFCRKCLAYKERKR